MLAFDFITIAWRNVLLNWRHSAATILAMAAGFMSVSLFDGFIQDLKNANEDGFKNRGMLGNVIVQRRDAQHNLQDDLFGYSLNAAEQAFLEEFIKSRTDVKNRVRFLQLSGFLNAGDANAIYVGYGFDLVEGAQMRGDRWRFNTLAGLPLHEAKEPSLLVAKGLAHLIDCRLLGKDQYLYVPHTGLKAENRPFECPNPLVTLSATTEASQVNAIELPIVGVFDAGFRDADLRAIHLPLEQAQKLLDTDKISLLSIQLKDESESTISAFVEELKKASAAKGFTLDILPWQEHSLGAYAKGGMQILSVFRNLFMLIVITIGVMSVTNTMMKSVNERIREIGTLRSLGFLKSEVISIFAWEGFFISLVSCLIGLVGALILTFIIGQADIHYRLGVLSMPMQVRIEIVPSAWMITMATLTLLATLTSLLAARNAAKLVVADALRHVA